jgi:hypothetical protein
MRYFIMPIFSAWALVLGLTGTGFAEGDMTLGNLKEIGGDFYQGAVWGGTLALRSSDNIQCGSSGVSAGMVQATLDAHKEWNKDSFPFAMSKALTALGCSLHLDAVDPHTPKAK